MSETFITNTDTADDEADDQNETDVFEDENESHNNNSNLKEYERDTLESDVVSLEKDNNKWKNGKDAMTKKEEKVAENEGESFENGLSVKGKSSDLQESKVISKFVAMENEKIKSENEKGVEESSQEMNNSNKNVCDNNRKGNDNEIPEKGVTASTNEGLMHPRNKNGESSMISYESGGMPPKNTPAHSLYGSEPDGRVQPMYVRFPGQRHGLMMFAEMNQQAGKVRIVGRDKEKEMLARLSWLLLDAGTTALKKTFDSIHPPAVLREHLMQPHVKAILQRLLSKNVLDDRQWKLLYPMKKKPISSHKFDSRTLVTLLETICHLCPPYPNGWSRDPLIKDTSLSADIVRLQLMFMELTRHDTIPGEVYTVLFAQTRDILLRLAGPPIRIKISRIEQELLNLEMQSYYIQTVRSTWQRNIAKKLDRMYEARTRKTHLRNKTYAESKGTAQEGLSPEDRVVLTKTYKLFVDHIPPEDVLDRLQQSQVIKHSDRQEILTHNKKSERIHILLDKIANSKLPYALKALIDAIKFKYKKIYEQVMLVRKITYKEGVVTKIDTVGITQDALKNYYRNTFSRIYPYPWSDTIHASIRDIFTPVEIVDENGTKVHQNDLLPPHNGGDGGPKILLEGVSGSGKSMLCAWIAYMWAIQPQFFKHSYQQVLYLHAHELEGNLEAAIYKRLLPENFRLSVDQFWNMLETKSHEVLVLLDGFDQSSTFDVSGILAGTRLRRSTVIMAVNPDDNVNSQFSPDRKWFMLGFNEPSVKRCLKTCVNASRLDHDQFDRLYKLVLGDRWALKDSLVLPILTVKIFAIFNVLRRRTILKEMKTECDIMEKYGAAMASLYCKRNKIDVIGFEFPDEIISAVVELDKFAYICRTENKFVFTEDDVALETSNPIVCKLGAFLKLTPGCKLRFSCGVTRDFLAAKHMADMVYSDLETAILQYKMLKLPTYTQVMSFLCGQYRHDYDTPVLRVLFELLAARNEYCIRGNHLPEENLDSQPGTKIIVRKDMSRGVLKDFKTSLNCLSECPEREEALETIALSFPTRLIMKIKGVLTLKMVEGLRLVLGYSDCPISEIVIELNQCHHSQLTYFLPLATAIGQKQTIQSLKVTWSSLDMMAKFLAGVTSQSKSLENVVLTEDLTDRAEQRIPAATWAALQSACSNMVAVKNMAFFGVRNTSVVNHVLQHIPTTIAHLDLSGCAMNLMSAGELGCHLQGNTAIRFLDLSSTKLNSAELVAVIRGLQLCESIKHVCLRGASFDRSGVIALSEFLRLTHSLVILDLSECELTTDMCLRLAAGMRQNRSLRKIILKNTQITSEARRMFTGTKLESLSVEGLPELYPLPLI